MTTLVGLPAYMSTWFGQIGLGLGNYGSTLGADMGLGVPFYGSQLAGRSNYTPISVTLVDSYSQDGPTQTWEPLLTPASLSGGTGSYTYYWDVGAITYNIGTGGIGDFGGQTTASFVFVNYVNGAGITQTIPITLTVSDGVTSVNSNTIYLQFTGE
jgi:hypothetical protein